MEIIAYNRLQAYRIMSQKSFKLFCCLLGTIMVLTIGGILYLGERASRGSWSDYAASIRVDGHYFNQTIPSSFLSRPPRSINNDDLCTESDLPPVERCICNYCTKPPEERCILWCMDNVGYYSRNYPIQKYHALLGQVLNVTNCWVCTRTPLLSENLPMSPVPASHNEITKVISVESCEEDCSLKSCGRHVTDQYNKTKPPIIVLAPHVSDQVPFCFNKTIVDMRSYEPQLWTSAGMFTLPKADHPVQLGKVKKGYCDKIVNIYKPYVPQCAEPCSKDFKSSNCISCTIDYYNSVFDYTLPVNVPHSETDPIVQTCQIGMIVATMVLGFDIPYLLPHDMYYICRKNAYKWLPPNSKGLCYLGRIIPQFYTITHNELKKVFLQDGQKDGQRYKRDIIIRKHLPLIDSSIKHRIGTTLANIFSYGTWGYLENQKEIVDLAQFIDNVTELYDETFRYVGHKLKAFRNELLQHKLVLDYLTAQSGGYCLTLETNLGVHCCNYLTNNNTNPNAIITNYMNKAYDLKEDFKRAHYDPDSEDDAWWSMFNPST
ncbi:uncharacterized protein LOC134927302 [Pseudophryne corroboree]|uniref:uncharacterized protein LOC134927302 n=1 Tax=Pseudophryne corroboree TaxID=495146 RepID=UPI003081D5D7